MLPSLILLLTLAGSPAAGGDDLDPVASQLAAARDAYVTGDLEVAHDLLARAAEQAPGEPSVHLWLARVLNDLGRAPEAVDLVRPALERNPESGWLWAELGRALLGTGDRKGAEAALLQALECRPAFGLARLRLVELLLEDGRPQDAERALAPLLRDGDGAPPALLAHASVLQALGRADEAERALRTAAPESSPARLALVRLLSATGRAEEAWSEAAPLLQPTLPGDPDVLAFVGRVAVEAGHGVEALAVLGSALVVDPDHTVALGMLNELIEHDAASLRRALTERWVETRPTDAEAWRELLEVELDEGHYDAFFTRLATLSAELRGATPVRLLEGEALRRAGRDDEARRVLDELCERTGEPRAWYELGLLDYAHGEAEAAAAAFARGADGPWAADAHFNRGVCLDRLERYGEAAEAWRAAAEARPGFAEAWYRLGTTQRYRLGAPREARESFLRYLDAGGDDPEVRRFVEEGR